MIYLFVLLLRIVAYLEGSAKIVSFVAVFGIIGYSVIKRTSVKTLLKVSKVKLYSLIVVLVIMFHSLLLGELLVRDIAVLMTYWIWFIFTYTYLKNKTLDEALRYIFFTFLIFNIANYLFFEIYFSDQKRGINALMRMFGIVGYRIYFPLSSGANVFTFQIGVNALLALYFVKRLKRKLFFVAVYLFYLFMLILADSRLILLFTLFFSFIYLFSLRSIIEFLKRYWYLLVISIVALIFVFYNTTLFDSIKRPGEKTGESISRIEIWGYAFDVLVSDLKFAFGHGLNGLQTGLEDQLKSAFENENLQTSHSFILQNLIDFGVVGVIIILFYLFKLIKMLIRLKSQIITVILVMFLLIGTTESIPTFYSFEATIFIIAILSTILVNYEGKDSRHTEGINTLS